jgi:hypothetical protein
MTHQAPRFAAFYTKINRGSRAMVAATRRLHHVQRPWLLFAASAYRRVM